MNAIALRAGGAFAALPGTWLEMRKDEMCVGVNVAAIGKESTSHCSKGYVFQLWRHDFALGSIIEYDGTDRPSDHNKQNPK